MTEPPMEFFLIRKDELEEVERILNLYLPQTGSVFSSIVRSRLLPEHDKQVREKCLDELATEIIKQAGIDKQRPFNPDTDCIPQLGVDELSEIIDELRGSPC